MSEWWTYRLSNFLLFSPRTYYRLFELYNRAVWPAQITAILLGAAILLFLLRPSPRRSRWIAAMLAACWLWVAIAFHFRRYATINWSAIYFGWAFALEAAVLLWTGAIRGRLHVEKETPAPRRLGFWIFLFALLVQPFLGPLLGRGWRQIELFGIAPDPTAVATLGVLSLTVARGNRHLLILPAIWCAITGATLQAMEAPDAWMAPLAAIVSVLAAVLRRRGNKAPRAMR